MDEFNNVQRMDALIAAQNRNAVATLTAAIVQTRNAIDVAEIIKAMEDADHILSPNRNNSRYVEWRKRNGLDPA